MWYADVNDLIGGYFVGNKQAPLSQYNMSPEACDYMICETIGMQDAQRIASLLNLLEEDRHMINFDAHGWTIQHPLKERLDGDLFNCAIMSITRAVNVNDNGIRGTFWLNNDGTIDERQ